MLMAILRWAALVVAVALFVSCSSKPTPTHHYYNPYGDYAYDDHWYGGKRISGDPYYRWQPQQIYRSNTNELITWLHWTVYDYTYPDLEKLHFPLWPLQYGINEFAGKNFSIASNNILVDWDNRMDPQMALVSSPGSYSFSVTHFGELAESDIVKSLTIDAEFLTHNGAHCQVFLAFRQGPNQRYQWYGPYYETPENWAIFPADTMEVEYGGGSPSLLVVAVDGAQLRMNRLDIEVDAYGNCTRYEPPVLHQLVSPVRPKPYNPRYYEDTRQYDWQQERIRQLEDDLNDLRIRNDQLEDRLIDRRRHDDYLWDDGSRLHRSAHSVVTPPEE